MCAADRVLANDKHRSPAALSGNPLQIDAALRMTAIFQIVVIVVRAVQASRGTSGILTTAAVLGLTDVDALTLSMARGVASLDTAALAITIGVLSNTLLKSVLAVSAGAAVLTITLLHTTANR